MFTWDRTKCDSEIYNNGAQVLMLCISNEVCDKFIEDMSNKIGCKLDYFNAAGRNIVGCYKQDYQKAHDYFSTKTRDDFTKYGIEVNGFVLY